MLQPLAGGDRTVEADLISSAPHLPGAQQKRELMVGFDDFFVSRMVDVNKKNQQHRIHR